LRKHHSALFRDDKLRRHFNEGLFNGFDFDPTMLRIGSMNMALHGVEGANVSYRDSLAEDHAEDAGRYSLVLANPPFAGALDYEATCTPWRRRRFARWLLVNLRTRGLLGRRLGFRLGLQFCLGLANLGQPRLLVGPVRHLVGGSTRTECAAQLHRSRKPHPQDQGHRHPRAGHL
jgi:N-6 DNA methylase